MSEFDKEAEREKLREKFERDKEKRESTQRMSELLLKGATMTNRHCDNCGDPIFRYDGQEFCPSCQQPAQQNATATERESAAQASGESGTEATAQTTRESTASQSTARTEDTDRTAADDVGIESGEASRSSEATTSQPRETTAGRPPEAVAEGVDARSAVGDAEIAGSASGEHEDDLTIARASLSRSVERYARAAEQTDDPRRAKEHLAAAHEAAEALAALER